MVLQVMPPKVEEKLEFRLSNDKPTVKEMLVSSGVDINENVHLDLSPLTFSEFRELIYKLECVQLMKLLKR